MEKTYKCNNGHKFKKYETVNVTCPVCNEHAELVHWNSVDKLDTNTKGFGLKEEFGSVVNQFKGSIKY